MKQVLIILTSLILSSLTQAADSYSYDFVYEHNAEVAERGFSYYYNSYNYDKGYLINPIIALSI